MASVVFLRGVNVGGHRGFQPSTLARELAELDVVNVGAAGTFVVRKNVSASALRSAILKRLPFTVELMISPARDLLKLAGSDPFRDAASGEELTRYVSILEKRPRKLPELPMSHPDGPEWQVKVLAIAGRFALSLHRRLGRRLIYPNEVIEQRLGVRATTRNWNTIAAICEILSAAGGAPPPSRRSVRSRTAG